MLHGREKPELTCEVLTNRLLVSLQGATISHLRIWMKAEGQLVKQAVGDALHFVSDAGQSKHGDVYFGL